MVFGMISGIRMLSLMRKKCAFEPRRKDSDGIRAAQPGLGALLGNCRQDQKGSRIAMKVVFVLPPFDMSRALGSKRKMQRGFLPSLGVGYVAASVESCGHSTALIDAQIQNLDSDETVDQVLNADPDIVGISAMSVYAHSAYAIAGKLKERNPNLLVVMGGPHTTSFYNDVLHECPAVDIVVPGEGETVFAELVEQVSRKEPYHDVKGILFRDSEGNAVMTDQAPVVKDLDSLPHVARHLFDPYPYKPLANQVRYEPATTAITSRGCSWGKCTFCFQGGTFSPAYRRRSPENVIEELNHLVRDRGHKEIIFWDDTFAVNPRWIERFCDLLERERLNIAWSCYAHMRAVKPDMLKRMAQCGCYNIYYGFESGVQEILDLIRKGTDRQQIRDAVQWTKEAGIQIRGSFILGFPTETPEMTKETIDFACSLNADWMMFFPFHLQRGTAIEEVALTHGHIMGEQSSVHFPSYVSSAYESKEQLDEMVKLAYRKYYLRPSFWMLALKNMIKHPVTIPRYVEALKFWMDLTKNGTS